MYYPIAHFSTVFSIIVSLKLSATRGALPVSMIKFAAFFFWNKLKNLYRYYHLLYIVIFPFILFEKMLLTVQCKEKMVCYNCITHAYSKYYSPCWQFTRQLCLTDKQVQCQCFPIIYLDYCHSNTVVHDSMLA